MHPIPDLFFEAREPQTDHSAIGTRQAHSSGESDNARSPRASFAVVSLLCMLLMASLFGSRFHSILDRKYWTSLTFLRIIPYLLYFFGISFNIASALSVTGAIKLVHAHECKSAMDVCLTFYVGTKVVVQLFLIERAHAVRANTKKRLNDWVWLTFMFVLTVGFGIIAILAYMGPVGVVNEGDQQCRIGLPQTALKVLMTYDLLVNVALTSIFIVLLRPLLKSRSTKVQAAIPLSTASSRETIRSLWRGQAVSTVTVTGPMSLPSPPPPAALNVKVYDPNTDHLKVLIGKSCFGAVMMLTGTMVNLTVLYQYNGEEHGWMCFMCCLLDVTWSVAIVHLLTEGRRDEKACLIGQYDSSEARGERYQRLAAIRKVHSDAW